MEKNMTLAAWTMEDAQTRFLELIDVAVAQGPQTIIENGDPIVVVIGCSEWERLAKNTLYDANIADRGFLKSAELPFRSVKTFVCG
jgi:prevent-host-death family protein